MVLLLSGIVSRLRPLLGCLGSGYVLSSPPPPSSWSLSPLFAVTLGDSCRLTGSLLARCCLACGAVRLCTEEPCRAVLGRRELRAFYEVTPPWVCLDRPRVLPAVPGSHSLLA